MAVSSGNSLRVHPAEHSPVEEDLVSHVKVRQAFTNLWVSARNVAAELALGSTGKAEAATESISTRHVRA